MKADVAIDNDFFNHLLQIQRSPDIVDLVTRFFEGMNVSPYMHQFVYQYEEQVVHTDLSKRLFENGIIKVASLDKIFNGSEAKKNYYSAIVLELYKSFTGNNYPFHDVFNGWQSKCSLGEIHTIALCVICSWACFLSDDKDAKVLSAIVKNRFTNPIKILNRVECCDFLRTQQSTKGKPILSAAEIKIIAHKNI